MHVIQSGNYVIFINDKPTAEKRHWLMNDMHEGMALSDDDLVKLGASEYKEEVVDAFFRDNF